MYWAAISMCLRSTKTTKTTAIKYRGGYTREYIIFTLLIGRQNEDDQRA
jgi:hypothetical protein